MYSYDSNCDGPRGSSVSHTESAVAKPFGPNGCEVAVNGGKCGETKTLRIIDEFRELYEEKMMQIDTIAGGDCTQAKIKLQQEWINDLTNQNELLVRAVEELEVEATERVRMLEERIKQNASLTYEVMRKYRDYDFPINIDENFQRVAIMQSDIRNLIEFVRRIREDQSWNTNGLQFYHITYEDLFGSSAGSPDHHQVEQPKIERQLNKMTEEVENKNLIIEKLEEQLTEECGKNDEIRKINDAYQEISELKQSMKDMRDALTAEVADKHDIIVSLRREVVHLEDQCRKADQQTHFKDDIIKELRKEIKQLKHQIKSQEKYSKHKSRCSKNPKPSSSELEYNLCTKGNSINIPRHLPRSSSTSPLRQRKSSNKNQAVIYMKEENEFVASNEIGPRIHCYTFPLDSPVCQRKDNCETLYINPQVSKKFCCKHHQDQIESFNPVCIAENYEYQLEGTKQVEETNRIPENVKVFKPRTKFTDTDFFDSHPDKYCPNCLNVLSGKTLKGLNVFQVIPLRDVLDHGDLLNESRKKSGKFSSNLNTSI